MDEVKEDFIYFLFICNKYKIFFFFYLKKNYETYTMN